MTSYASGVLVRALNFEPDNRMHGLKGRELGWRLPDQGHQGTDTFGKPAALRPWVLPSEITRCPSSRPDRHQRPSIRQQTDAERTLQRGPHRADTPPRVGNYVTAGVGNSVTDNPSNLGKYVTADNCQR